MAICVLLLLENEKGASKPSFLRTENNSHPAEVVQWQRREHVTELLPIKVDKAKAGLVDGLSIFECCEVHASHSEQFPGRGRKAKEHSCQLHIILSRYKTTPGLQVNKP